MPPLETTALVTRPVFRTSTRPVFVTIGLVSEPLLTTLVPDEMMTAMICPFGCCLLRYAMVDLSSSSENGK